MKFKAGTRRRALEYEKDLVEQWKKPGIQGWCSNGHYVRHHPISGNPGARQCRSDATLVAGSGTTTYE